MGTYSRTETVVVDGRPSTLFIIRPSSTNPVMFEAMSTQAGVRPSSSNRFTDLLAGLSADLGVDPSDGGVGQ